MLRELFDALVLRVPPPVLFEAERFDALAERLLPPRELARRSDDVADISSTLTTGAST